MTKLSLFQELDAERQSSGSWADWGSTVVGYEKGLPLGQTGIPGLVMLDLAVHDLNVDFSETCLANSLIQEEGGFDVYCNKRKPHGMSVELWK